MPEIGQGYLPKPLQKPHPPIVVTAVAPFSKGVTEAAARGWDPISANFLMPEWVKSHWPKYVEGCERVGRKADPANWRVAKSIFVADDDKTAKAYATGANSPYRYYYSQLYTKLKKGRLELFKTRRDQPDSEVTLDGICNDLIIHGSPSKVADEILKFREQVGDFGTLLYAGKDWRDPRLGQALDDLAGRKGAAEGQCRDQEGGEEVVSRPRVFVTQPIAESALARLRAVADVEVNPDSSRVLPKDKLIEAVKRCDILLSLLHDTVDRDVLAANPKLKAVSSMNITQDRIDLADATARGIPVTNIPAIVTDATADIGFGLLLAVARNIALGDKLFRSGIYPGSQSNHLAGAAVSRPDARPRRLRADRPGDGAARPRLRHDDRLLRPAPLAAGQEEAKFDASYRSFDDLLREADFVSLHPQLLPETRHLMSDRQFSLMKPSAFVINTSRGPVIDEAALVRALKDKKIAGAGLDVYEHEPEVSPELVRCRTWC